MKYIICYITNLLNTQILYLSICVFFACSSVSFADIPGTDPNCYDPANIGTVGDLSWSGCAETLIVNRTLLDNVIDNNNNNRYSVHGETWNVSRIFTGQVTDMSNLFRDNTDIGDGSSGVWNITNWDTSNVTSMAYMFRYASAFNQPIGDWETSNVTTMYQMFYKSPSFNQPIGNWDTSKVVEIDWMLAYTSAFEQSITNWCVPNILSKPSWFDYGSGIWNQTSLHPNWGTCPATLDQDGDGFTPNDGDCDDTNPSIYPGAKEICGNSLDENCDGVDSECGPAPDVPDPTFSSGNVESPDTSVSDSENRLFLFIEGIGN